MTLLHSMQNRWYLLTVFLICMILIGGSVSLGVVQTQAARTLLLEREKVIAGGLLEMGVSQEIIAAAFGKETGNEQGRELLARIGRTENTPVYLFLSLQAFQNETFRVLLPGALLCAVLIFGAAIWLLTRLDLTYQRAERVIHCFAGGDFSSHLPRTGEGTLARLFAAVDDLASALQEKGEKEHRTKEFLKDTISDISHQLKTPLAALRMYHEIIADEPDNAAVVMEFSQKTEDALKRMEGLISSLLKITRLDAGSITYQQEKVQVAALVNRAMADLRTRAVREQKQLMVYGDAEETLVCDLEWTSEALGNLIKNALDHTKPGGRISLFWERSPAMLRIIISDNGSGIRDEDIHHIFKRFYRSSHSVDRQGVGLGLSLAKAMIEGQGGVLSVRSSPDQGTAFTVSFLTKP